MKKYRIQWEKLKLPDEVVRDELEKLNNKGKEESYGDSNYKFDEEAELSPHMTFMGADSNPFLQLRTFNFWTAHCNFYLSPDIANSFAKVPGIESINIVSPYRMHISIGKLFDESITKNAIATNISLYLKEHEQDEQQ